MACPRTGRRPLHRRDRRGGTVSLEHLWAGWRSDYIVEATARERSGQAHDAASCVFCRLAASGPPSEDNLVVWRGELTFVVMNAYPYASGHVLVLPLRHVGPLAGLTPAESAELWSATQEAVATIEAAYEPDGLNMGANLGRGGRRRAAGARPPPRPAALVRRHQLHDVGRGDPGRARDAAAVVEEAHRRLAPVAARRTAPARTPVRAPVLPQWARVPARPRVSPTGRARGPRSRRRRRAGPG